MRDADMPTGERIKILDFGIAKLADFGGGAGGSHTRTGALMGTPLYMAPEQARGAGEVDARADLYALGCMLYEMLVGAPPFVAEGAGEIIALQLFGEVLPPRARVPALSAPIEAIALRLLEKEPDARFQSSAELVEALARLLPSLSGQLSAEVAVASPSKVHKVAMPSVHGRPSAPAVMPSLPPGASHSQVAAVARPRATVAGEATSASTSSRGRWWIPLAGALAIGAAVGMFALVRGLAGSKGDGSASAAVASGAIASGAIAQDAAAPGDAPPSTIALTLALDPPTATVALDGQPVAPGTIAIPRDGADHAITASAPGFVTRTLTVRGDRDQTASLALAPEPAAPVAPTGPDVASGSRDHTRDHGRGRGTKPGPTGPSTHPDGTSTSGTPLTTSPNGSPIEPSI
ncbi:MAG: hypothetical protein K8W52_32785 [Deltaproteobacteria bacterium]|nr:hypothetical protein [Deltaproteobacteria bacterium]